MPRSSVHPYKPLPLRHFQPTAAHVQTFTAWYQGQFGVVLEPKEAAERLAHVAELFALLGAQTYLRARYGKPPQ